MRYLLALAVVLVLAAPGWSQVVRGLTPLGDTSYTSEGVTLTIHADRPTRTVLMSFATKDGPPQTVVLNAAQWRRFCALYRKAGDSEIPNPLLNSEIIGEIQGIQVSLEAPYITPFSPFPGTVAPLPETQLPVTNIIVTHGDLRVAVNKAMTFPLDNVIETAQRDMGVAADSP